jgi:hypothetical protein
MLKLFGFQPSLGHDPSNTRVLRQGPEPVFLTGLRSEAVEMLRTESRDLSNSPCKAGALLVTVQTEPQPEIVE